MKLILLNEMDDELRRAQRGDPIAYFTQLVRSGRFVEQDVKDLAVLGDRDALGWCENNGVEVFKIDTSVAGGAVKVWEYLAERCPDLLRQEFMRMATPLFISSLDVEFEFDLGYVDAVVMALQNLVSNPTTKASNQFNQLARDGGWAYNPHVPSTNIQNLFHVGLAIRLANAGGDQNDSNINLASVGRDSPVWDVDVRRLNIQMVYAVADQFIGQIWSKAK